MKQCRHKLSCTRATLPSPEVTHQLQLLYLRLQELQLLTAKQELEQLVQRLKAQAEQKGVHLNAGECCGNEKRTRICVLRH